MVSIIIVTFGKLKTYWPPLEMGKNWTSITELILESLLTKVSVSCDCWEWWGDGCRWLWRWECDAVNLEKCHSWPAPSFSVTTQTPAWQTLSQMRPEIKIFLLYIAVLCCNMQILNTKIRLTWHMLMSCITFIMIITTCIITITIFSVIIQIQTQASESDVFYESLEKAGSGVKMPSLLLSSDAQF